MTQNELDRQLESLGYKKGTLAWSEAARELFRGRQVGKYNATADKQKRAEIRKRAETKADEQKAKKQRQNSMSLADRKKFIDEQIRRFNSGEELDFNSARQLQQMLVDQGYDISFKDKNTGKIRTGADAIDGRAGKATMSKALEYSALLGGAQKNTYDEDYRAKYGIDPTYNTIAGRSPEETMQMTNMYYDYLKRNPQLFGKFSYATPYMTQQALEMLDAANGTTYSQSAKDAKDEAHMRASIERGRNNIMIAAGAPAHVVTSALGAAVNQLGRVPGVNTTLEYTLGMNLNPEETNGFSLSELFPSWQYENAEAINPRTGQPERNLTLGNVMHDSEKPSLVRRTYNAISDATGVHGQPGLQYWNAVGNALAQGWNSKESAEIWDNPYVEEGVNQLALMGIGQVTGATQLKGSEGRMHNIGTKSTPVQGNARVGWSSTNGNVEWVGPWERAGKAANVMSNGKMPSPGKTTRVNTRRAGNRTTTRNSHPTKNIDEMIETGNSGVLDSNGNPIKVGSKSQHWDIEEVTLGNARGGRNGYHGVDGQNHRGYYANRGTDGQFTYQPLAHRVRTPHMLNQRFLYTPLNIKSVTFQNTPQQENVEYTAPMYTYQYTTGSGPGRTMSVMDENGNLAYQGIVSNGQNTWADQSWSGRFPRYDGSSFKNGGKLISKKYK